MFKEIFEKSTKYKKGQTIKFYGDRVPYTLKKFIKFGKFSKLDTDDTDSSEYWKCTDGTTINIPVSDNNETNQIEYLNEEKRKVQVGDIYTKGRQKVIVDEIIPLKDKVRVKNLKKPFNFQTLRPIVLQNSWELDSYTKK
jgi:hypothetical protein